jgi:DNA invertase Pin-like site-specific DNA recombinase
LRRSPRAGIERAQRTSEKSYLGRKPTYTRGDLAKVHDMLSQGAVGIAHIARETGLSRQTVYRIKHDPAGAEAALAAWG